MANITLGRYTMKPQGRQFDLYKQVERTKGGGVVKKEVNGPKYLEDQAMGFGMPFETCLDTIAKDRMEEIPGNMDIPTWIKMYKEIKEE